MKAYGDTLHTAHQARPDSLALPDSAEAGEHTTLAWRITQRMQGASPQLIDSVIQAHIPKRERILSTRPDTLEIPGLKGHRSYEIGPDHLDRAYELGFFKDNPLLHPELHITHRGQRAVPRPYQLWRDDWVTGSFVVSLILLVYIINHTRRQFVLQAKDFFFPAKDRPTLFAQKTTIETQSLLFMVFLLSIMGGFMSFVYAQHTLNLFLSQVSPYLLLFIYTGCFMAYFAVKRLLNQFVNWVFFNKFQQNHWKESAAFLISFECLLIFPLTFVFIYFKIPILQVLLILGIIIVISKLMFLYRCYTIFFPKIYCLFHLFAYLCALELMPLAALWKSLVFITDNLIIRY